MAGLRVLTTACILTALLSGCAEQIGVSNRTDSFSLGGQAANLDDTLTYTWSNTQSKATVNWGGQVASGELKITLRDADGKQVYVSSISGQSQGGGNEESAPGRAGSWTIQLTMNDFTGQMGLNVNARFGGANDYCPPSIPGCR